MLSFTAIHALSGCLLTVAAEADAAGWDTAPTLLLIHVRRPEPPNPALPQTRAAAFPLHPDDLLTDPADLPALLGRLADGLRDDATASAPYRATLSTILGLIRDTEPDARLLAWAALYDTVRTADGQPHQARRIDAVDTDGRVYQLTQVRGQDHPLLRVDDTPTSGDAPPTVPGLAALLAASTTFTRYEAREVRS